MNFNEKLNYGNKLIEEDNYLEAFDIFCVLSYERPEDIELQITALKLFDRIVEGNYDFEPSTANEFLFRGVSKFYKNEYLSSNDDYDRALSLDPNLDIAYYNKGLNYGHLKRFDLAIKEIEIAISMHPCGTYFNELAQMYYEIGNFNECFKFHEKTIELVPKNQFFWFTYGAHLGKAELWANSASKLQKAVELDPQFLKAKQALAYVINKLSSL